MEYALKNCPFCGNEPQYENDRRLDPVVIESKKITDNGFGLEVEPFTRYWVTCKRCGARGGCGQTQGNVWKGNKFISVELPDDLAIIQAINNWNRRAQEAL